MRGCTLELRLVKRRAFGGHDLRIVVGQGGQRVEGAALSVTGNDRRGVHFLGHRRFERIEAEAPFGVGFKVAMEAGRLDDGLDFSFEVDGGVRARSGDEDANEGCQRAGPSR
jgi:hypothetical protein